MKRFTWSAREFSISAHKASPTFSCAEMRAFDRFAVESLGVPALILMENAGRSLTDSLLRHFDLAPDEKTGNPKRVLILAGRGNNGGDGFVMARRLRLFGVAVEVTLFDAQKPMSSEMAAHRKILEKLSDDAFSDEAFSDEALTLSEFHDGDSCDTAASFARLDAALLRADVVVDALLGTGARGTPRPPYNGVIERVNATQRPVFAVDLPSGLNGDTGEAATPTIRATVTCTLGAMKTGLLAEGAREWTGQLDLGDIGLAVRRVKTFTADI